MLELTHIDSFYGETQVLFDVSLTVDAGEVVALLGANGAGKTTTLRSILGLTRARGGAIRFDGVEITRAPPYQIARAGIGWVPDDRRIFPTLTVERNLAIARKQSRFRAWQLGEIFEIFSALEYLVLLDEPSQGLAPKIVQDVMKTILRMKAEGLSVLLVEQHARNALEISDRVYVMDLGRIVHEGPSQALLEDPALANRLTGER